MSGYQRMVSYLYRYDHGAKGKNVGYVRMERRGERCRATVRFRDAEAGAEEFAFFVQEEGGLRRIPAGRLVRSGGGYRGQVETDCGGMMHTEYTWEQVDGVIISASEDVFFATTWKEIEIHTGRSGETGKDLASAAGRRKESTEKQTSAMSGSEDDQGIPALEAPGQGEAGKDPAPVLLWESGAEAGRIKVASGARSAAGESAGRMAAVSGEEPTAGDADRIATAAAEEWENTTIPPADTVQTQARRKPDGDFGKKLLAEFPRMYPFALADMGPCVRLELKDIGCLPVKYWSLAGNPLLLQGYFCYRHLIFAALSEGVYAVGIPGIYSEENGKYAGECGIHSFQPLSEAGSRQGAFGYWLYEIRDAV